MLKCTLFIYGRLSHYPNNLIIYIIYIFIISKKKYFKNDARQTNQEKLL